MISSTVVVACKSAKRWFDLDAVRVPHAEHTLRYSETLQHGATVPDRAIARMNDGQEAFYNGGHAAGAPPLDWHLDGHTSSPPFEPREGTEMLRYIVGDTRDVTATIPDDSVDLIFTSPPFLALRSYLPADHKDKHREIGSEANPAAFIDVLLELTAEWGRVLAPHGTLAVELGDTYSGAGGDGWDRLTQLPGHTAPSRHEYTAANRAKYAKRATGWPLAKSLALIPQLYAIALAYGINPLTGQPSPAGRWRVRNVIMWHRPNPPVGALGDKWRPASSYITVACRGPKRWFDLDSVRGEYADITLKNHGKTLDGGKPAIQGPKMGEVRPGMPNAILSNSGPPPLDWHTDGDLGVGHIVLSTQPYAGSHYATFPMDLPRKIIDCMCPRQVCRICGSARERQTGPTQYVKPDGTVQANAHVLKAAHDNVGKRNDVTGADNGNYSAQRETLGWTDCAHDNYRPGVVFDPFVGTGTTLAAAQDLGRDGIGVDIDPDNAWLARERVGMFCTFETHPSTPTVEDVASPLL